MGIEEMRVGKKWSRGAQYNDVMSIFSRERVVRPSPSIASRSIRRGSCKNTICAQHLPVPLRIRTRPHPDGGNKGGGAEPCDD